MLKGDLELLNNLVDEIRTKYESPRPWVVSVALADAYHMVGSHPSSSVRERTHNFQNALRLRLESLGNFHPATAASRMEIAKIRADGIHYHHSAIFSFVETLIVFRRTLGKHRYTAETLSHMSAAIRDLGGDCNMDVELLNGLEQDIDVISREYASSEQLEIEAAQDHVYHVFDSHPRLRLARQVLHQAMKMLEYMMEYTRMEPSAAAKLFVSMFGVNIRIRYGNSGNPHRYCELFDGIDGTFVDTEKLQQRDQVGILAVFWIKKKAAQDLKISLTSSSHAGR